MPASSSNAGAVFGCRPIGEGRARTILMGMIGGGEFAETVVSKSARFRANVHSVAVEPASANAAPSPA